MSADCFLHIICPDGRGFTDGLGAALCVHDQYEFLRKCERLLDERVGLLQWEEPSSPRLHGQSRASS